MECFKCKSKNDDNANFCNKCGNKLVAKIQTDKSLPPTPFDNVKGKWTVTTEGDVEGRSIKNLGTFEGNIDEIARQLAHLSYYSLYFRPFDDLRMENKDRKKVNITLPSDYGINKMKNLFVDKPVIVKECNYYHTYTLEFED